jgi:PilZ domain
LALDVRKLLWPLGLDAFLRHCLGSRATLPAFEQNFKPIGLATQIPKSMTARSKIETGGSDASLDGLDPSPGDRRRHARVAIALAGRYMLEDGSEYPCECIDISAGGLRLRAAKAGPWGSRIIAYIDGIGRIEGHLVRRASGWFAIETRGTTRKEERVEERIAWIMDSETGKRDDRRRLSRQYLERQTVCLATLDGRQYPAELTDVSKDGAALLIDAILAAGERVRLDGRRARVTRAFPGGLAIKFENWVDESRERREGLALSREGRTRRA